MKMKLSCPFSMLFAATLACAAADVESLAKYDKDPDGEIVSQRVVVSAQDDGGDTVVKTITVTREVRKRPAKKSKKVEDDGEEEVAKSEFPPPPSSESADPKRLVRYFCRLWKDEQYKQMYGAMHSKYCGGTEFEKFQKLFVEDAEMNGGLADENIVGGEGEVGASVELNVTLTFNNKRVKPRSVKARVVKTPNGYRLQASPILPIDLDDL